MVKTITKQIFLLLGILFLTASSVAAQFFTAKPLNSVSFLAGTSNGDNLYMADIYNTTLYLSSNAGSTWTTQSLPSNGYSITSMLWKGTDIYMCTQASILKYSTTAQTFSTENGGLGSDPVVNAIELKGGDMYGAAYGKIYKLPNGSSTWSTIYNASGVWYNNVFVYGSDIWITSSGNGILKSSDDGATWNSVPVPSALSYTVKIISVGSTFFACTGSNGIYKSVDNGVTWTASNTGIPASSFSSVGNINTDGTILIAGSQDKRVTYRSADLGATWTPVSGMDGAQIYGSFFSSTGVVYAYGQNGLYKSTDAGLNWSSSINGIKAFTGTSILVQGSNILVNTYLNGMYKSTDGGTTWTISYSGIEGGLGSKLYAFGSYVYAIVNGAVYRSADFGSTWTVIGSGTVYGENFYGAAGKLYVCGSSGIFSSTDYGNTWTQISTTSITGTIKQLYTDNLGYMYVMSVPPGWNADPLVYQSVNNGVIWSQYKTKFGAILTGIKCITMHNNILFAGTSDGVYKYSTVGTMPAKVYDLPTRAFVSNGTALYIVGAIDGNTYINLAKTLNNGTTWSAQGMTPCPIDAITIANSTIYVSTHYSGPYLVAGFMTKAVTGTYKVSADPDQSNLSTTSLEVFPNPVTDYAVVKSDNIIYSVSVYNLQGGVVLSEDLTSIPVSEYEISLNGLDKGVYMIKVMTNAGEETLKLVKE